MNALLRAIFPPSDGNWTWRRRMAFSGCAVFLAGIIEGIWFEPDLIRSTMIIEKCSLGFAGTLGIYAGLATLDDNNRRKVEAQQ